MYETENDTPEFPGEGGSEHRSGNRRGYNHNRRRPGNRNQAAAGNFRDREKEKTDRPDAPAADGQTRPQGGKNQGRRNQNRRRPDTDRKNGETAGNSRPERTENAGNGFVVPDVSVTEESNETWGRGRQGGRNSGKNRGRQQRPGKTPVAAADFGMGNTASAADISPAKDFTSDITPDFLRSRDEKFGFLGHEDDAVLDAMPPDPTLDAVFADAPEVQLPPEDGTLIVGIRFAHGGKSYYFDPGEEHFRLGDHAIVETARGIEFGDISIANRRVPDSEIVPPLRKVLRRATPADVTHNDDNHRREDEAFTIAIGKIEARKLDMKLVGVQYTFDNTKLIFYFTSAGRVDFRELVKDLAAVFRTRIELRQIGIRDEAKMIGGWGVCGRKLCCSGFLPNFAQVSIRMAKEQGLSLNSSKISGSCGRLMCCLRFEQDTYEREIALMPPPDSVVDTPDGRGVVTEIHPIGYTLRVSLTDKADQGQKTYRLDDVTVIERAAPKKIDDAESHGKKRFRGNPESGENGSEDAGDNSGEEDVIPED